MVSMGMAQAVYQHAHDFYDTGSWYVVAECWDLLAIAEELDRQEEITAIPMLTIFRLPLALLDLRARSRDIATARGG